MKKYGKLFSILLAIVLPISMFGCAVEPSMTTVPDGTNAITASDPTITSEPATGTADPAVFDVDLSASWTTADIQYSNCAAFSDVGYYHLREGKLCFMDTKNGITVVLCQKTSCDHLDTDCEAYIPNPHIMFFSGSHIYYDRLVRSDPYSIHIFRRGSDGTAEEKVAVLGKEYISSTVSLSIGEHLATEGALYFTIYMMEAEQQDNGSIMLRERDGILVRLDLETGTQQEILRKQDTLIRLIGARKDALLFYTLDKLPDEMNLDVDYYDKMKSKPAKIQAWDKEHDSFLVLREETYAEFTNILGLQDGRVYYKDYDGVHFTYEVATDTISETDIRDSLTLANDRYIINGKYDPVTKTYPQFVNCKTGKVVPSAYSDAYVAIKNKSETGCVIEITYEGEPEPLGNGSYSIPRLRQITAYVAFAALDDGLQESDLLIISDERFDG